MKKTIIAILIAVVILAGGFLIYQHFGKRVNINSEVVYFSHKTSGSRAGYTRYLVVEKRNGKVYVKTLPDGEGFEEDLVEREVSEECLRELTQYLKDHKVGKWAGFEKYNKNVLDGTSWSLDIRLENDKEIEANGYMSYPKNYREIINGIYELVAKY